MRHKHAARRRAENSFFECGCCGHFHRVGWTGDCRDDEHRWTWERIEAAFGDEWRLEVLP